MVALSCRCSIKYLAVPIIASAPLHVHDLAETNAPRFLFLRLRLRLCLRLGLGLGLSLIIPTSRKSRTASYLAMRHIWHDTGVQISRQSAADSIRILLLAIPTHLQIHTCILPLPNNSHLPRSHIQELFFLENETKPTLLTIGYYSIVILACNCQWRKLQITAADLKQH